MCSGCEVRKKAVQITHEKVVSIRYAERGGDCKWAKSKRKS